MTIDYSIIQKIKKNLFSSLVNCKMENHKEKLKNKEQNLIWNNKKIKKNFFFVRCRPHFCLLCLEAIKSMLLCHTKQQQLLWQCTLPQYRLKMCKIFTADIFILLHHNIAQLNTMAIFLRMDYLHSRINIFDIFY